MGRYVDSSLRTLLVTKHEVDVINANWEPRGMDSTSGVGIFPMKVHLGLRSVLQRYILTEMI